MAYKRGVVLTTPPHPFLHPVTNNPHLCSEPIVGSSTDALSAMDTRPNGAQGDLGGPVSRPLVGANGFGHGPSHSSPTPSVTPLDAPMMSNPDLDAATPPENTGGDRGGRQHHTWPLPQLSTTISKKTKANMTIGTLNIRGAHHNQQSKWPALHSHMYNNKISLLALQETHLAAESIPSLPQHLREDILLLTSLDPSRPNAGGVSFAINRRIANSTDGISTTELVPGCALLLQFPWHHKLYLNILNVYAPNDLSENAAFWRILQDRTSALPPCSRPHVLLGDFNVVEEAVDRLPSHPYRASTVSSLQSLLRQLHLTDGWRTTHRGDKDFSYLQQATQVHSRIDRIYVLDNVLHNSRSWELNHTPIPTDHRMASVQIVNYKSPQIGEGRWSIPLCLLDDPETMTAIEDLGNKALADLEHIWESHEPRRASRNTQYISKKLKEDIISLCKKKAKKLVPI